MSDPNGSTPLDLREMLRVIVRRKWLLLLPWGIAVVAGVAAAFLLPPIYFSSVTLLLERPQSLSGALGGMVNGRENPDQQAEVMREQVGSSLFLRSVVTASGVKNDEATIQWARKRASRYSNLAPDEAVEAVLVNHLRNAISIRRGKGNVFEITVGDNSPMRAQRFAEAVSNQFVVSSKAQQLEAVRATQEFSVEQQAIYKRKLDQAESKLEAFRRANLSNAVTGAAVDASNVQRARALVDQAALEADDLRQRISELRSRFGTRIREKDPDLLSSPQVNQLTGQLVALERQLGTALLTDASGDGGAAVRAAIARKANELESELTQNAAAALPGASADVRDLLVRYRLAQADLAAREARRSALASQVASYERQVVMTPDRELEMTRLSQEVENARALYNSFLQQSAAAQIAEAFENAKVSGRFVVLEPAMRPYAPGKPNRLMLIMLAFVVGGIVGLGVVLVAEQHDQSVKDAEEVERMLGLPVLGAIPRVEELDRSRRRSRTASAPGVPAPRDSGLLHRLQVESPLGLEFRRIYLKLAKSRGRTLPHTLLLTSATRGEGKTTTSACLAITLARELREKVLVVDFDLRSPSLHRALGLPTSSWGLAQMLHQRNFDERFVRATVLPHLDFLAAGKSDHPASELVETGAVEWFVREASQRYPIVILDSAPNLAVPDSLILGRAVEGVLYVIKAGSTIRKAAEYGVRVQREARDNVLGVLMNDAGEILPQYYGYRYSSYGYSSDEVAGGES